MPDGSDRPIAFASRTLSKAEKNYSQIEKEGLACVFGVKRFHTLLYGHKFTLITDHQPLLSLFSEAKTIPIQAAARIQRWALTLAAYEYVIQCKPTARHSNADALSRLPLPSGAQDTKTPVPPETVLLIEHLQSSLMTATHIKKETAKDPLLSRILQFVQTNWPSSCSNEEAKPYWQRRIEISVQDECLLWGNRVIVPPKLREAVLSLLHEGHPGIVRMKSLGRMFMWWPGLNQSIEDLVRSLSKPQGITALSPFTTLDMAITTLVTVAHGLYWPIHGTPIPSNHGCPFKVDRSIPYAFYYLYSNHREVKSVIRSVWVT